VTRRSGPWSRRVLIVGVLLDAEDIEWRLRWFLRASTAPAVSFTLRRLLLLFGGPSFRSPLGVVRVWRTDSLPAPRSTSSHFKPNNSPCLRPVVMANA
jgi:hypothetical protein